MNGKFIFDTSSTLAELGKKFKEAKSEEKQLKAKTKISISVLSNFSTQYLVNSLYTSMIFNEINTDIYDSSFDQWEFELNNPISETYTRNSDYVLIALSSTRLILNRDMTADDFAENLKNLLLKYKETNQSEIILVLPESLREGFDQTSFFTNFAQSYKKSLRSKLKGIVHFIEIDPLIMEFGFEKWHSPKFLISAKLCCHPNCFALYGDYISSFIQTLIKAPTKLIIIDLDNTLWDGVVGDLGWEGVGLDGDGKGYPHIMLQTYLLSLKKVGVLLALCSKNSLDVAKKVFDNRKEMILKFDDFVAVRINWEPKSGNILQILDELNLTTSGVMFLDDSKFEREEVRNQLPGVFTPELPDNTERWCEFLSKSGYLTIGKAEAKDALKSEMYFAEKQRKESAAKHSNYSEFLKSLDLTISAQKINSSNFDRVFELIHKTNQFNLTSKRLSRKDLSELAANKNCFCYCYGLKDKYSDYGIISVFIAEKNHSNWEINTWLMSCRAMGRGVEYFVFDHFLSSTLTNNEIVRGNYIETEKNKPVADLLQKMGFTQDALVDSYFFTMNKNENQKVDYIKLGEN